ncbi:MAG: caspase family protein [Brasilonema octagenarum HA4186-MV1]|jgi:tetratricopeptide (TPR) repeat protein|nr:caspase family protein [Brasilonema octagenarum HA4186-MV1]
MTGKRRALIIANNEFEDTHWQALYAPPQDAKALAEVLADPAIGNFEVEVLLNKSRHEVEQEIDDFFGDEQKSDLLLLYFSGHGFRDDDDNLYLVTRNTKRNRLASTAVSSQFIIGIMSRSIKEKKASGQVLLLDCCHSGSFAQPGVKGSQSTAIEDKFLQGRGRVVLTSSRAAQRSYEEKEADEEGLRLSYFTRALVQGLKTGKADIDGDGFISSVDLYQYVYQRIGKEKPDQTPQQWDLATEGKIIIAKNPHAIKNPWRETRQYVPSGFKVLDQKFFDNEKQTPEAKILKLRVATWSLIIQGNYIERDGQDEPLNIAKKMAKFPGISLMLIRGEPGAGKTAIMRSLVYQLFLQGHLILEKTQSEDPDWREQLEEFSEKIGNKHFYVIADDLFRQCELEKAQSHFPFTLIGTTRFNEDKRENLDGLGYEIKPWDVKRPNQEEKKRIIAKVCEDETVKRRLDSMTKREREELMNDASMLVLMLQLSEGKPFDLIIADVIKRLPSEERYPVYEVYGVICSFYQYGITVPPEILPLCLPEYSKKAVDNVVEFGIHKELKELVNIVEYKGGFKGLATIHELIAKTAMSERNRRNKGENQPYSSTCLEEHLRAAIQAIDATKETHKRWANNGLTLLAVNGQANLVHQILNDYTNQIQSLQQECRVTSWYAWAKMYEAMGFVPERDRCLEHIMSTTPQSLWEWVYRLSLIARLGTREQKQEAIAQTATWLQLHLEDWHVRVKYLALIGQCRNEHQQQEAIAQTATWLQLHLEDWHVRTQYLALIGQCGKREQKQEAITDTATWLDKHQKDTFVRTQYLALIGLSGNKPQQQEAIADTATWLQQHPENWEVRTKYLALIEQCGNKPQQQEAIAQTTTWLQLYPNDRQVRTQYLALIRQCGKPEQQQQAITQTTTWLQLHPQADDVRTSYLGLVGKAEKEIIDVEPIIKQQWQWLSQQQIVDQSLWYTFLPFLYHHAQPSLIQEAINLALQQYPENTNIICLVFGYFRDHLDYETCYRLADFLRQSRLPTDKWQNYIHAANFFRDYGDLDKAEDIYQRVINSANKHMRRKHSDDMQKNIRFASLNYARFLVLCQPPEWYKAIGYLKPILDNNSKHSVAHLYMAQCYQVKGQKFYPQAINHFLKAIEFDQYKNGYLWYEFGCFQRDTMENSYEARKCFQKSLQQKINILACVSLADLDVKAGRFDSATEYLQQGLALVPITRPEKEQQQQLEPLIQQIQQAIQEHCH